MSFIGFAQHGTTRASKARVIARPEEGLIDEGIEEASKAGEQLKRLLGARALEVAYVSPPLRAYHTLAIILGSLGLDQDNTIVIKEEPRLAPRGMGWFVGEKVAVVPWDDEKALQQHGVEPSDKLAARHRALMDELTGSTQNTLLVGHSSSIDLLVKMAGLPPQAAQIERGDVLVLRND